MATQISVNSGTGTVQVQISRTAIGQIVNANVSNTANNLNATSTANVIIGGGVANYVLQTDGVGNTSWVAQTGGGATNPSGANTQVQFNDQGSFGADATFTYDKTTDVLSATHFNGEGGNISNIQGANVSGAVALATSATTANAVAGANVSGAVAFATTANSVAVANVAGIGNIATTNYDGNVANYLTGTGTWAAAGGGSSYGDSNVVTLMGAFGSNTISTTGLITGNGGGLSNIAGANVSGAVANATLADFATTANAVAGANVSGEVAFSATANSVAGANVTGVVANATHSTISDSANSVAVANVAGIGNIATVNLDGNVANVLSGDGTFIAAGGGGTYGDSNVVTLMGAFGSNTILTTGNITSGNLSVTNDIDATKLTLSSTGNGNVTTAPASDLAFDSTTFQTIERYEADTANEDFKNKKAYVLDNYDGATYGYGYVEQKTYYANTGTAQAIGGNALVTFSGDIGNTGTDPLIASSLDWNVYNGDSNLANPTTATGTTFSLGNPGIFLAVGAAIGSTPVYQQWQYSDSSIRFNRRNGNGDARTQVVANDLIGKIEWNPGSLNGSGFTQFRSSPSYITAKVDSSFAGATPDRVGQGFEFGVVDNDGLTFKTHDFYANGDVTFNATGVITGDGGGLSNIASANVSGLGNIATVNLDGNVGNYLTGTGTWAPAGGGGSSSQIANGTSNVDIATVNGDVTIGVAGSANVAVFSSDTLTLQNKLLINDSTTANVLIDPTSTTSFDGGTVQTLEQSTADYGTYTYDNKKAYVINGYGTNPGTDTEGNFASSYYANDGVSTAKGYTSTVSLADAISTNPLITGQIQFSGYNYASNLANASTGTGTTLTVGNPSLQLVVGSDITGDPHLDVYSYSDKAIRFSRRNGNGDARTAVVANDYLGNIEWRGSKNGSSMGGTTPAAISPRVDSAYAGGGSPVPIGIEMNVVQDTNATLTHNFYANGDVTFNSVGVITGDGGGLSNVSGANVSGAVSFGHHQLVLQVDSTTLFSLTMVVH